MNAAGTTAGPRHALQRRAFGITTLLLSTLMTACAITPAPAPAPVNERAAAAQGKAKRVLPRDILSEWGTFGLDPRPGRRVRAVARLPDEPMQSMPNPTIREIMASASCRDCAQKPYHHIVLQAANTHGVPPALIHAVIEKESGYNPRATSARQARGLMQLMPGTGRMLGVGDSAALYDPHTNIHAGTAYLRLLMESHDSVDEVLAAYNAGPGNVRRYNGIPPFGETRRYVHEVKRSFTETSAE
jgi:soluble lytic murein transglycosylase-like protein